MSAAAARLPEWIREVPQPSALAMSRDGAHPTVMFWWPAAFGRGAVDLSLTPGLIILSDVLRSTRRHNMSDGAGGSRYSIPSRRFPGSLWRPSEASRWATTGVLRQPLSQRPAKGPAAALGGAWASAFESAVEDAALGLRRLADAGVDIPEIGYEYADEQGVIIAEAELAWPRSKVCVLLDGQAEFSGAWATAGWRYF